MARAYIHLDRGYDSEASRERLEEERRLLAEISQKGKPSPLGATKRWVVERTSSWHNAHKKLVRCTERRGRVVDSWVAFSRRWSSSHVGSSGRAGAATAGRVVLPDGHDLSAQALSTPGGLSEPPGVEGGA